MFDTIKNWSGWSTAGTIFKSRLEVLVGFITAGVASVVAFDWMPFITEGIDWIKIASVSGYLMITGVVGELTRRAGTKTVDGMLIPTAASIAPVKIKTTSPKTKKIKVK